MSYVDGFHDTKSDLIKVVERAPDGSRVFKETPPVYEFFYEDPRGKFQSIHGTPLSRVLAKSTAEFKKEIRFHANKNLHESDINPVFKHLSTYYLNLPPPKLHVAFLDIETDFDKIKGFAPPNDPFMPITAISIYLNWIGQLITVAVPPKTLEFSEALEMVKDIPGVYLFEHERELLTTFLDLIDDADVLSGWNSRAYDIPFIVNRIIRLMGKEYTKQMCLWGQLPKPKTYEMYGSTHSTYDLIGRQHMDYLDLYKKYNYEERYSYKLDSICELELGEKKVEYEGSLDRLYNQDFRMFIEYNRQDAALLHKLDLKLQFIDLSNNLAHDNGVLLPTTMGSVAAIEQAIINEAHSRGLRVPDRSRIDKEEAKVAGAYVAHPKIGIHKWLGSIDINSLYPSVIRALNMGPESIVGQLEPTMTDQKITEKSGGDPKNFSEAWEGMFSVLEYDAVMNQDPGAIISIRWEDDTVSSMSGAELYKLIFDSGSKLALSANGTIFSLEQEGVIPSLLSRWYSERKEMQATLKNYINLDSGIKLPDRFLNLGAGT